MNQPISRLHAVIDSVKLFHKQHPGIYDKEKTLGVLEVAAAAARLHSSIFVLGETAPKAAHDHDGKIEVDFPFMTPYPCTVLEYDAPFDYDANGVRTESTKWSRELSVLLCSEPDVIASLSFTKVDGHWAPSFFVHEFLVDRDSKLLLCRLSTPTVTDASLQKMAGNGWSVRKAAHACRADISFMGAFVFQFLQILQCKNVRTKKVSAPAALQRKQARREGTSGFSFRTLHIERSEKEQAEAEQQGLGRHSPRLHFRRGHVRRLSNMDRTWVSACMVGSDESGEVRKVYAI